MAKPNYSYEKRQKELAKQKKKEEKRQRRLANRDNPPGEAFPEEATAERQPPAGEHSTDN